MKNVIDTVEDNGSRVETVENNPDVVETVRTLNPQSASHDPFKPIPIVENNNE